MSKDRISIITDEVTQDLEKCRRFLDDRGLRAVEVRCASGERAPFLKKYDFDTLRRWTDSGEIIVTALSPGLFKVKHGQQLEIERHLGEVLPRTLDMAHELGASFVVSFTFDDPDGEGLDQFHIDAFRVAARECEKAGLKLLIENEPGYLATTAGETLDLVERIDHPACGVNWDPANSNVFDTAGLSEGLEKIVSRVKNVHVKNCRALPGQLFPEYTHLSEGEIDWKTHVAKLGELEYEGYLCVETHFEPLWENSARAVDELRAIMQETGFQEN